MSTERVRDLQQPVQEPQKKQQSKVKVHKKQWISTGEKFLYTVFTGAVMAASIFMVNFTSSTDTLNRNIQELEQQVQQQQSHNETLAYQVKELSNPDRILEIAKEHGLDIQNAKVKQAGFLEN
ncbi:cell division protein FtsL [Halobacillus amylolyticus]|uniref:Cell division protein FtsL n=1 Tax=Halobacillus amylolyticus TaxID=2932259 RepID=A0ABY4HEU5_9BACI|nr:cell division protein FtsL [Halobacillus amylolyticus]UOR12928.1 cell division protein FtsL [Halobacillus amylolyticus]